jgi:hypothetical protein
MSINLSIGFEELKKGNYYNSCIKCFNGKKLFNNERNKNIPQINYEKF